MYYFEHENDRAWRDSTFREKLWKIKDVYSLDESIGEVLLNDLAREVAQKYHVTGIYDQDEAWESQERAYSSMGCVELLIVYTSYVNLNDSRRGVESYSNALRNFDRKLSCDSRRDWVNRFSDLEKWLIGLYFNGLTRKLAMMRACEVCAYVAEAVELLLHHNPELKEMALPFLIEMMKSCSFEDKDAACKALIAAEYAPELLLCVIAEYFESPKESDTFFADRVIQMIPEILRMKPQVGWRAVIDEEDTFESEMDALKLCLGSIEKSLLVSCRRGHEEYALRGLKEMCEAAPVTKEAMSKTLMNKVESFVYKKRRPGYSGDYAGILYHYKGGRYKFLSGLYNSLSTDQQETLNGIFEEGVSDEELRVLSDIFISSETSRLNDEVFLEKGEVKQICTSLERNRLVLELMSLMVGHEGYEYEMGVLLSLMDFSDLPQDIAARLSAEWVDAGFKLKIKNGLWSLCNDAETRLVDAMYSGAVVVVNDKLLVKFKGKFTALCLKSFTSREGFTFVEGNWYSPVDEETRQYLKNAYSRGCDTINIDSLSEWVLIRTVEKVGDRSAKELLTEAKRVARGVWENRGKGIVDSDGYRYMVKLDE